MFCRVMPTFSLVRAAVSGMKVVVCATLKVAQWRGAGACSMWRCEKKCANKSTPACAQ